MSGYIYFAFVAVVLFASVGLIVTLPRWTAVPLLRIHLWDIHDKTRELRRAGLLPDDEATKIFLGNVRGAIRVTPRITRGAVGRIGRYHDALPDSDRELVAKFTTPPREHWTEEQRAVHRELSDLLDKKISQTILFSTWGGLVCGLWGARKARKRSTPTNKNQSDLGLGIREKKTPIVSQVSDALTPPVPADRISRERVSYAADLIMVARLEEESPGLRSPRSLALDGASNLA